MIGLFQLTLLLCILQVNNVFHISLITHLNVIQNLYYAVPLSLRNWDHVTNKSNMTSFVIGLGHMDSASRVSDITTSSSICSGSHYSRDSSRGCSSDGKGGRGGHLGVSIVVSMVNTSNVVNRSHSIDTSNILNSSNMMNRGGRLNSSNVVNRGNIVNRGGRLNSSGSMECSDVVDGGHIVESSNVVNRGNSLNSSNIVNRGHSVHSRNAVNRFDSLNHWSSIS